MTDVLEPRHHDHLIAEGFSEADIAYMRGTNGVRSISHHEARALSFSVESGGGLLFPFTPKFAQLRCDTPPMRGGKSAKYLTQAGKTSQAYSPHGVRVITEGLKDAIAGSLHGGIPTGALAGVSHYKKALLQGCGHTILFDSDGWQNPSVFASLIAAAQWCAGKIQLVPEIENQPKAGLCEYFRAGNTSADYEKLIKSALTPKQFLLELPSHWQSMPIDRVSKSLRTLFSLGCTVLDPIALDQLSKLCKTNLKFLGVTAGAVNLEYKRAIAITAKRRRREQLEKMERSRLDLQMDLTDVCSGVESKILNTLRSAQQAVKNNLRLNELRNQLEYCGRPLDPNTCKLFVAHLIDEDVSNDDCTMILGAIGKKMLIIPLEIG